MHERRPSPDELLARIKAEEQSRQQGSLTIFLGYAAGVGKTYAMLEAAQQQKNETDLVIAYVETHGRAETDKLLDGLQIIPPKHIDYRGIVIPEMDLDAVLNRKPQIALVDELAHTNVPGSRHLKRYQDVEELLDAGIDVYTTLNIQHVESVRNTVAQVTGVWVRETVPDSIIDRANEIKLIDLPPDELLLRLKQGKVYVSEQIAHAVKDFFRKGNLSALREVAMRIAAENVERQTQAYRETHAIEGSWPAADHILAYISTGRRSNAVIRSSRRLASQLNADWTAIYVETPDNFRLSQDEQSKLNNTVKLAKRLGAKVLVLQGQSIPETIAQYADSHNITKIVVGEEQHSRLHEALFGSVVSKIIRRSRFIDVYVVADKGEPQTQERQPVSKGAINWRGYLLGVGIIILATIIGALLQSIFHPVNLIMIYLLCVVISAIFFGFGPSVLVSILAVLAFDFFFIKPIFSFTVEDVEYLLTFAVLLAVGIVISYLTMRIRRQIEATQQRQVAISTLYELSREITATLVLKDTINTIVTYIKKTLGFDVIIMLPDATNEGRLNFPFQKPGFNIDDNDLATAFWAFEHQQTTGRGTETLPDAKAIYIPLNATNRAVGVIGIWITGGEGQLSTEQLRLLEAMSDLAAVAIERAQLAELMSSKID